MEPMNPSITFRGYNGEIQRPILHQYESSGDPQLPVLDCEDIFSSSLDKRLKVAWRVSQAFRNPGVIYATNHGLGEELVGRTRDIAARLFHLPLDRKMQLHEKKSKAKRGYQYLLENHNDEPGRNGKIACGAKSFLLRR